VESYYYAGGRKLALERDHEFVALDQAAAASSGVDVKALAGSEGARRGAAGVLLVRSACLDARQLHDLRKAGALLPVFRRDRAILVALPEVRVEFDDAKERKAVKALLAGKADGVSVTQDDSDLLVLRPSSGDADDALTLANQIHEDAGPAASSVRFIQFVPKPRT
jgi:hypothetical protein